MAPVGVKYPSVFVVDSNARPPPLPPKPGCRRRTGVVQTLLVILVSVALCGMAVEACFIYHLYTSKESPQAPPSDPQTSMRKQEKEDRKISAVDIKPSKPVAHLTTGGRHSVQGVMLWNQTMESILYHIKHEHNEGKLIIQREGYYSIYSKISYMEDHSMFTHSVLRLTPRYVGGEILLLQSRRYHLKSRSGIMANSYVSGVFHLFKDDALFVRVKFCSVAFSNSAENYFGLFMV